MEVLTTIIKLLILVFELAVVFGVSYLIYMTIRDDVRKERERMQK